MWRRGIQDSMAAAAALCWLCLSMAVLGAGYAKIRKLQSPGP